MTQWVENPGGGRDRGPVGLLRAWVEVVLHPRRFFRTGIAPGDQAPGLVFAVCVTLAHLATRFALAPSEAPVVAGQPALSLVFTVLVAAFFLAPAGLHLAGALAVVGLAALVDDRAGVSQTIQVVAYAAAPLAVAGVPYEPTTLFSAIEPFVSANTLDAVQSLPFAVVRLVGCAWAFALLVVGFAVVHDTDYARAALAALLPGTLVFVVAFDGVSALELVTGITVTQPPTAKTPARTATAVVSGVQGATTVATVPSGPPVVATVVGAIVANGIR